MYLKTYESIIVFINLKAYVKRQYIGQGIQIVSLFLYMGTLGEMAIQICECHKVPGPRAT